MPKMICPEWHEMFLKDKSTCPKEVHEVDVPSTRRVGDFAYADNVYDSDKMREENIKVIESGRHIRDYRD